MNLKFTTDEIKEYVQGPLHIKNEHDGASFEVDVRIAKVLLRAKTFVGGELVNIFEPDVKAEGDTASHDDQGETNAGRVEGFPNDFPAAASLADAGYSYEEAKLLTAEQLTEIKGIGPKTADAIVEFIKE